MGWSVVASSSTTRALVSVAFGTWCSIQVKQVLLNKRGIFFFSLWHQEKLNGWICLHPEQERPKGKQEEGSKKEAVSVCCMTEVVLPAIVKQETRCVLDRKVNICGVLVFRKDKNWDFINLVEESGCFDVEVVLVCSGTDMFCSFQNQL